jgi:hypothetical protein
LGSYTGLALTPTLSLRERELQVFGLDFWREKGGRYSISASWQEVGV